MSLETLGRTHSGTRTTSCHGSSVASEDYGQALSTDSCKLCQVLCTGQLGPTLGAPL